MKKLILTLAILLSVSLSAQTDTLFVYGNDTTTVERFDAPYTYDQDSTSDTLVNWSNSVNHSVVQAVMRNDSLIVFRPGYDPSSPFYLVASFPVNDSTTNLLLEMTPKSDVALLNINHYFLIEVVKNGTEVLQDSITYISSFTFKNAYFRLEMADGDILSIKIKSQSTRQPSDGWKFKSVVLTDDKVYNTTNNLSINTFDTQLVSVYPNPFRDRLNFSKELFNANYQVFNLSGQLVLQEIVNGETINLSNLNQGTYILKVTGTDVNLTTKIIKSPTSN